MQRENFPGGSSWQEENFQECALVAVLPPGKFFPIRGKYKKHDGLHKAETAEAAVEAELTPLPRPATL